MLAKRLVAGVEVVAGAWLALFCPPKSPELEPVAEPPPPNRLEAGLSAGLAASPNRPPVDGVVLAAPPKSDAAGAEVVGVELLPPPKRDEPPGVVAAPEKRLEPAGFWAPAFCCPKMPLAGGAAEVLPAVPPPPNVGAPPPNRPPVDGAVELVLLAAAPDELGVPKLKDIVAVCRMKSS